MPPTSRAEDFSDRGKLFSELNWTVLVPVYNDWAAAGLLAEQLDTVFAEHGLRGQLVFIDDGSTEPPPQDFPKIVARKLDKIVILELRKNLGHQRALAVGLVFLNQNNSHGPVLVMDADGEDSPSDIPMLMKEFSRQEGRKIIFAARGRRTEGFVFKLFYQIYRTIHRVLVGFDIRVGNFSAVPAPFLERLVVNSDLWNHYAAAIVKMKLPCTMVPIDRAKRLAGQSNMGFVGLVIHGLSAMSVFGDVVGVRLLIASALLGALTFGLVLVTVAIKFATNLAIPGWATYTTGLLLLLLSECVMLSLIFTFVVLYSRGQSNFVPIRDCPIYVSRARTIFARHD